ncbi:hypothetical protein EVAR_38656_1 [Eumeta japonica]|uniref:Uncharacterized protein n=1 Tax=Eumeta variegata TaxID=151549 RepID=A0A4C1Y1I3_EUMVA|nr:hypothetical protein EVAR_38656_1 [Eumeta japonica]
MASDIRCGGVGKRFVAISAPSALIARSSQACARADGGVPFYSRTCPEKKKLIYPKSNVYSDYSQHLIKKHHTEPLYLDDLGNPAMDSIHFKMKNIMKSLKVNSRSRQCRSCSEMIKDDHRCAYHTIQNVLGIGFTSMYKILHDELQMKDIVSHCVSHHLTQRMTVRRMRSGADRSARRGEEESLAVVSARAPVMLSARRGPAEVAAECRTNYDGARDQSPADARADNTKSIKSLHLYKTAWSGTKRRRRFDRAAILL